MDNIDKIKKIGNELVRCDLRCSGITNDWKKGIVPRGLIYESRKGSKRVIVIGINPGQSDRGEQNFYKKNNTYGGRIEYWKENSGRWSYHRKARKLIDMLGFKGDILWTDLAKCQCEGNKRYVPIQTFRTCIDKFLEKEIDALPENFTIIALGDTAFNFCALRFPHRFVLGLPHPAAWGSFYSLERNIKKDKSKYNREILKKKDKYGFRALNLGQLK